jgi:hypothetical protein
MKRDQWGYFYDLPIKHGSIMFRLNTGRIELGMKLAFEWKPCKQVAFTFCNVDIVWFSDAEAKKS